MAFVSIRDLGLIGLISDKPNYDLQDNAFNIVNNVRFFNGTAQKSSSPVERFSINADALWGEIFLKDGVPTYTYATETAIYEIDLSGVSQNVSKAGGYSASEWQSTVWGDSPIYNNGGSDPQIKEGADLLFKDLPSWPANTTCKVIRAYKNFLIALNINDFGTDLPTYVRWSTESSTGEIPASWEVLPTNLAGSNQLTEEEGEIIDGLTLGDSFIIYTQTAAFEMSFIGGNFVMSFRKFSDNGLINVNAVCAFDNFHFCVSGTSIYTHDGHSVRHIADQRVRDFLFQSTTNTTSIKCEHLASSKECIIYFEADGSGSGKATKALIWCYRYDTWSFIDLPGVRRVQFAYTQPTPTTWADWSASGVTWDELTETWAQLQDLSLASQTYLISSATNSIDDFDTIYGSGVRFNLERTGLDFDKTLGTSTNNIKYIDQILPQIKGSGLVDITVGWSDTPEGSVRWDAPVSYSIENDYKVDVRTSGRYPAWRFEGEDAGNFQLSGMDFNVLVDGQR